VLRGLTELPVIPGPALPRSERPATAPHRVASEPGRWEKTPARASSSARDDTVAWDGLYVSGGSLSDGVTLPHVDN